MTKLSKASLQSYVSRDTKRRLDDYVARKKSKSKSAVVEAALIAYLEDATDTDLLYRRLDRQSRSLARISRDQELLSEAFAVFVKLWFAHTPRVAEAEREAAQHFAAGRYIQFVDHVAQQFAGGERFIDDLVSDLPVTANDTLTPSQRSSTQQGETHDR